MLQYYPFNKIYNCGDCNEARKKARGCKRKTKQLLRIDCTCGGVNGCEICRAQIKKGSRIKVSLGYFYIDRCPVSFTNDANTQRILQYFWHWKATNSMMYPDNRGRYYQPSILLEAFSICGYMTNKREQIEIDNANNMRK